MSTQRTRRTRRTLRVLVPAALVSLAAACGVQPSAVITGASPPSGETERGSPTVVYLSDGEQLVRTTRRVGPLSPVDTLALLADGPTDEERARGLTSEVPSDAAPFTVREDGDGRTVVTLSGSPGTLSPTAVDQIVCTVAEPGALVSVAGAEPRSCPEPG